MDRSVRPKRPWSLTQELSLQFAVLGCWLAGFGAAALLEYAPNASLWFPPAGITFAALLVLGVRVAPALGAACLLLVFLGDQIYGRNLPWSDLLTAGLTFAFTHLITCGLAAWLCLQIAKRATHLSLRSRILLFVLVAGAAAGLAQVPAGLMVVFGEGLIVEEWSMVRARWLGDYAGMVTIAPLFAVLLSHLAARLDAPAAVRLDRLHGLDQLDVLWTTALPKFIVVTVLAASLLTAAVFIKEPALLYSLLVLVPILVWLDRSEAPIAMLAGVTCVTLAVAVVVSITSLRDFAADLQFLVITLASVAYVCASVDTTPRRQVEAV